LFPSPTSSSTMKAFLVAIALAVSSAYAQTFTVNTP
jgi:hypothetical protein